MAPVATTEDHDQEKALVDGRLGKRLINYQQFFQWDSAKDSAEDTANRNENYTDVVNGYYDGATELYEYGWAQSFHFSRFYKGEAFHQSLARQEHFLAHKMGLKPGMRVLDVGCGVGGPAREIAQFADVQIVGINNNDFQIGRARRYTAKMGLSNQVTFQKGDFMKLSEIFGENSFDAVYAIEATCHAPVWEGIYGEIKKVVKPGGVFAMYEWCMTESWDPSIPSHKACSHGIEIGCGIPEMRSISRCVQAIQNVGLEIEYMEDLAERPDEIRWHYPLEGNLSQAQTAWDYFTVWRTHWTGIFIMHLLMRIFEFVGILPKGTCKVADAMKVAGAALVVGGREKLFTPMFLAVTRKPLEQ